MNEFSYVAIMLDGSKTKGVIQAQNVSDAKEEVAVCG